jgi:flagellar hook assembly protein FlgD
VDRLYQNRPNPFNPRTTIRFTLARKGPTELAIYDVGGRLVRTMVDKTMNAGLHALVWDGTDDKGHSVGSGIYWSQLEVGDYVSSKKLVLLK